MNKVPERLLRERIFSLMHDACFEWPKQNKYEYTCLSLGALINSSSFQSNNNTGIFYICIVVNQKLGIKKKKKLQTHMYVRENPHSGRDVDSCSPPLYSRGQRNEWSK